MGGEERWRAIAAGLRGAVLVLDENDRIIESVRDPSGTSDAIGKSIFDVVPEPERDERRALFAEVRRTGTPADYQTTRMSPRGFVLLDVRCIPVESGEHVTELVLVGTDANEHASDAAETHRALFDLSPMPMWIYDARTRRIVDANSATIAKYGYSRSELLALTIDDLRAPDDGKKGRHRTKAGVVLDVELCVHEVVLQGRLLQLALANDVTDRVHLEEQLLQAQKMEAIGRLAGGIAHDFNNLLAVIQMDLDWIAGELGTENKLSEDVVRVRAAATRGAALTQQLLAFSRKQHLQPRIIVLNDIVGEMQRMMGRILGEDVRLDVELAPDIAAVEADPSQIAQVLVNLAVNARDAMPGGGLLSISTHEVDLDDARAHALGELSAGRYVRLRVSDTGHGMDDATRARAFEPFFTTKRPGKGTGLGLATVFGIVRQSGGGITIESAPGRGSTFDVFLPCVAGSALASMAAPPMSPPRKAQGTILLVEDDPHVRAAVGRQLRSRGFDVLEASDGTEAIACADNATATIDLLLTDVVMPGADGPTVATHVRTHRPSMRVLYMSGHTEHPAMRVSALDKRASFLQKPFNADRLAAAVRAALNDEPASSRPASA